MIADRKRLAEDSHLVRDIVVQRTELVHADLGVFGKAAVDKALDKLLKQMPDANVETLIKEALKVL